MHGPMGKYTFIAILFILAGTGFLMSGMTLYENAMFRLKGHDAVMVATDPPKWLIARDGNYQSRTVNVKYVAGAIEIPVPAKYVSGDEARRLAQGERIPVRYVEGDLQHVRMDGEQGDTPWGWLFAGFAGLALALYARKLAHHEARR
ncbi:MAG: DUF3592 domain-containing protein [Lysobacteraceae bacterium]